METRRAASSRAYWSVSFRLDLLPATPRKTSPFAVGVESKKEGSINDLSEVLGALVQDANKANRKNSRHIFFNVFSPTAT